MSRVEQICADATASARTLGEQIVPIYLVWRDALAAEQLAAWGERVIQGVADLLGRRDALELAPQSADDYAIVFATRNAITAALERATTATAPIVFRGAHLVETTPPSLVGARIEPALRQAIFEVHETVRVVAVIEDAWAAFPDNACPPDATVQELRARIREVAKRPLDWLFLRAALGGLWEPLALGESLALATAQATMTGWFGTFPDFDLGQAISDITMGKPEPVLEMLAPRDPETRARLLEQLDAAGFLDPLIHQLGWRYVKEGFYDRLPSDGHEALKAKLEVIFKDESGDETSLTHFGNQAWPVWWLYKKTFGPTGELGENDDDLRDARARGDISEDAFEHRREHLWARTAVTTAASFIFAGIGSKVFSFGAEALGIIDEIPASTPSVVGGAMGGGGATLTSDLYNIHISGDQDELSSWTTYAKNITIGALGGGANAALEGAGVEEPPAVESNTPPEGAGVDGETEEKNAHEELNPVDTAKADSPAKPRFTRPSQEPSVTARPRGRRTIPNPADQDVANRESLESENDSADVLARHGYDVEQNPAVAGRKRPDYRIEGEIFDNYAPRTTDVGSIWRYVSEKVGRGQTRRVVLNLDRTTIEVSVLEKEFRTEPIDGLEQILVVRGNTVVEMWP